MTTSALTAPVRDSPVRDSKNPHDPKLAFRAEAWSGFVEALKHNQRAARWAV
ncbi:DUF397 domain-containing protein [Streptomyces yerevanensis]|uniref:DUF397 domain-containing protein n=1 Tax=Streptomyces yerevanensis TaxID=66378 RepID=UPI000996D212